MKTRKSVVILGVFFLILSLLWTGCENPAGSDTDNDRGTAGEATLADVAGMTVGVTFMNSFLTLALIGDPDFETNQTTTLTASEMEATSGSITISVATRTDGGTSFSGLTYDYDNFTDESSIWDTTDASPLFMGTDDSEFITLYQGTITISDGTEYFTLVFDFTETEDEVTGEYSYSGTITANGTEYAASSVFAAMDSM